MSAVTQASSNESSFKLGNTAMRQGQMANAIRYYLKALDETPGLGATIATNLVSARKKYRTERNTADKLSVGVCGWELSHNAAGRVYTLATLYETFAEVEIIGSMCPAWGCEIWGPIRDTEIAKHSFVVENEAKFIDQAIQLVSAHPYDVIHLSKPRAPNIFFGILYKLIWDAKVLLDIDDEELAFVGAETPISVDEYLSLHGKLPDLKDLAGQDWTRLAVGLAQQFDGITVCNAALQTRYGGEIIRHARDEKLYKPSLELKRKSRETYGIPQDKKVVLFFGTPRAHKGLIETAQAIASLKRQDVLFCIAGDFPDAAFKKELQNVKGCEFAFLPDQPFKAIPEVVSIADCSVLLQDEKSPVSQFQTPAKLSDALGMGLPVLFNKPLGIGSSKYPETVIFVKSDTLPETLDRVLFEEGFAKKISVQTLQLFVSDFSFGATVPNLRKLSKSLKSNGSKPGCTDLGKLFPLSSALLKFNGALDGSIHSKYAPATQGAPEVDVVVPVYNALEDVKLCFASLARHTDRLQVRVIVVNDGSNQETTDWLQTYCTGKPLFHLIEHEANSGYTKAVNTGLRFSTAPYVITQNSDTIVSDGWLKGLIRCMESEEKIGIVGPLSNAASWQNVPNLLDEKGAFAINELPNGLSVDEMARLVARVSVRSYPRLPFANGFCFMIHRMVIDAVGYMDEENFPIGYGEENDFCIRAADAGFGLAIADDVYVFHAKSKSFGHEQRKELSLAGTESLKRKHTLHKFLARVDEVKKTEPLDDIRKRIITGCAEKFGGCDYIDLLSIRILFILPGAGGGGGSHSVVQEVVEMRRLQVDAKIAISREHLNAFLGCYSDIPRMNLSVVPFGDDDLEIIASKYDVIVATYFTTMKLVKRVCKNNAHILPAYYVQDYEPLFCPLGSKVWQEALDSYGLLKNTLLFAKTDWIAQEVLQKHMVKVDRVFASIDHHIYRPQYHAISGFLTISAMIRPQTPRRGAERTMRLFSTLKKKYGPKLNIKIFGCKADDEKYQLLEKNFEFQNFGELKRTDVAELLSLSDLFLDLSDYQAFGRTALEAMACGCAVVVPLAGGAAEYAINGVNSIIVDTENENEIYEKVCSLVENRQVIERFKIEGVKTAARYSVHSAAVSELTLIKEHLENLRRSMPISDYPRFVNSLNKIISRKNNLDERSFVTIGIPTYNRPKELLNLINGIVNNSLIFDGCKVLIVDDGVNDEANARIKELQNIYGVDKIQYSRNKVNLGYPLNFVKLFDECDTEYMLIVGDDNEIFPLGFVAALECIKKNKPKFVSSPWFENGKIGHRGWRGNTVGELNIDEFFNSSDHAPGLIYHCPTAKKYLNEIKQGVRDGCAFTSVFPQVKLALNLLVFEKHCFYIDSALGTETSVLASGITDPQGNKWRTYRSMLLQASDLDKYISMLGSNDDIRRKISNAAQKYYIKYLLKIIDLEVRRSL